MPHNRPFPTVAGGCFCGAVRYRLLAAPLFCYACHCADCHKHTGSVYACHTCIEADMLTSTGRIKPKLTDRLLSGGVIRRSASCPECGTSLWGSADQIPFTVHVRTGTLDHPELMEPDLHSYIESKIPWVLLPEGARTCEGGFDFRKEWPKSSLRRFEAAKKRYEEKIKEAGLDGVGGVVPVVPLEPEKEGPDEEREADKTPTAQSPEEKEDDEEFEKRYRETERALQERLEKLTLKLSEEEKAEEKAKEKNGTNAEKKA